MLTFVNQRGLFSKKIINKSYEIQWNDFVPNNACTNYYQFVWDAMVVDNGYISPLYFTNQTKGGK